MYHIAKVLIHPIYHDTIQSPRLRYTLAGRAVYHIESIKAYLYQKADTDIGIKLTDKQYF